MVSPFVVLITLMVILSACYKPNYTCSCNTNNKYGSYHLGIISQSSASTQCNALKSQYAWDTCLLGYPK